MAIYTIVQFRKPKKHRAGEVNRDIRRIGRPYHNITDALNGLSYVMNHNRVKAFVRLDKDVNHNTIAYADLNESGGVVRFRQSDGFHFAHQIPFSLFKERLAKRIRR